MSKTSDYQTLNNELDQVLGQLQRPDIQVDEAVELYQKGLKLINQLETQLKNAENKLEKIKLKSLSS